MANISNCTYNVRIVFKGIIEFILPYLTAISVRFTGLTMEIMKNAVFCDMMTCSQLPMFRMNMIIHIQDRGGRLEMAHSLEMLVTIYQTITHHISLLVHVKSYRVHKDQNLH
jgi:hypothetical protein